VRSSWTSLIALQAFVQFAHGDLHILFGVSEFLANGGNFLAGFRRDLEVGVADLVSSSLALALTLISFTKCFSNREIER
jgi:hypothetical protein